MNEEHPPLIKTPRQLIVVVALAFVIPVVLIMMLAALVTSGRHGATNDESAMLARIQPVGTVLIEPAPIPPAGAPAGDAATPAPAVTPIIAAAIPPPVAAAAADGAEGKKVYDTACAACHTPGIAGAPKADDKAAWSERIAKGTDVLYEHAIKGFQGKAGFMPPKGGNASLSEAQVKAAVDFMTAALK